MAHNKGKNTSPELFIRQLISSHKIHFVLHKKDLPGCPDIVFPKRKKVIFINGCFWHRHSCKKGRSMPITRKKFWQQKFIRTIERDKKNKRELENLGWKILIIWECQTKKPEKLINKISNFLKK
ncbi:MAG: DNA mismatch endonuclease Vsr [Sedimentisphaerales bacterium]|nr:DNA mismatch endonuclease Vsr [Sedimentisphaerales bacterium]